MPWTRLPEPLSPWTTRALTWLRELDVLDEASRSFRHEGANGLEEFALRLSTDQGLEFVEWEALGSAIIGAHEDDDTHTQGWHQEVGPQGRREGNRQARGRLREAQGHVIASEEDQYAWPSFDDVHEASLQAVENHQGYRDSALIEGAIGNTQMAQHYGQHGDIFDTAAHLIAKIQRQQAIVEGNKRTATAVGVGFLENNGYDTSGLSSDEATENEFISLIYHISDSVDANEDEYIPLLAQFMRERCLPFERESAWRMTE